jgi:hypothetical protein
MAQEDEKSSGILDIRSVEDLPTEEPGIVLSDDGLFRSTVKSLGEIRVGIPIRPVRSQTRKLNISFKSDITDA